MRTDCRVINFPKVGDWFIGLNKDIFVVIKREQKYLLTRLYNSTKFEIVKVLDEWNEQTLLSLRGIWDISKLRLNEQPVATYNILLEEEDVVVVTAGSKTSRGIVVCNNRKEQRWSVVFPNYKAFDRDFFGEQPTIELLSPKYNLLKSISCVVQPN